MVEPIRVLVTHMPTMLRDLVRAALVSHSDLEILPEATGADSIAAAAREAHAEIVIVGMSAFGSLHAYDDLLYEMPDVCLVGVTRDGRHAGVSRLMPHHEQLNDVNAVTLVDAVRAGAAAARERSCSRHAP